MWVGSVAGDGVDCQCSPILTDPDPYSALCLVGKRGEERRSVFISRASRPRHSLSLSSGEETLSGVNIFIYYRGTASRDT